jgi:hypothetical protein
MPDLIPADKTILLLQRFPASKTVNGAVKPEDSDFTRIFIPAFDFRPKKSQHRQAVLFAFWLC